MSNTYNIYNHSNTYVTSVGNNFNINDSPWSQELDSVFDSMPIRASGALVILSGGMDSTIAMRFAAHRYTANDVNSISFDYGQKQKYELAQAYLSSVHLGVANKQVDFSFLNDISMGFSANVDPDIEMPTIKDVLGDPTPKTYVPNRNMIMMSVAAAYAETQDIDLIICGLQIHDEYGYWDTTGKFVDSMNNVLCQNRKTKVQIIAPFSAMSKIDELKLLIELDGEEKAIELLSKTLTCYNPTDKMKSCGKCPSCSERINAFMKIGIADPLQYMIDIDWKV